MPVPLTTADTDASVLGPEQRAAALRRLESESFDVVVIGGGSTGTGAALDAATRGLRVALVEARDLASGTSSRSSKLIHGGLRYLEQREFGLVREALRERSLLLNTLAPHLVSPVRFMLPLKHLGWERPYVGAGMLLYDSLGGFKGLERHKHLSRRAAYRLAPGIAKGAMTGAVTYFDAQVDDARHTLAVARTAAQYGAAVATNVPVTGFLREGERVTGVRVRDHASDREIEVSASQVINATGVWTDELQHMVGERGKFQVRASKGVHLLVPRDRVQSDTGLILKTETSVLFVIPWGRHWIIGTTDTDWNLDLAHPAATAKDIAFVLELVNSVLAHPLGPEDVEGVYAGLRPLLTGDSDESVSQLSREHSVAVPVPGLVAVAGGKYTTYRVMGRDAVDAAARGLDRSVPESVTDVTELVGAEGFKALWNLRDRLASRSGLHQARIERLLHRHGSRIDDLLREVERDPTLGEPVPGADDYLRVEIRHAASHEGALHLDDVLARRTRISIETFDRGLVSARPAAELMGEVLGWTPQDIDREVGLYEQRVAAERESQRQPDDEAADAARLAAPDWTETTSA